MKYCFIVTFFLTLLFSSCEDSQLRIPSETLFVEGWIENGRPPIVMITKSLRITEDFQSFENLADYVVKWAKVSVCDGTDTIVLTGKYSPDYIPNYIYTTGRLFGEIGKKYTLIIEVDDHYLTSETEIFSPPIIRDYSVDVCDDSDSLYQISLNIQDVSAERDYYQCFFKIGKDSKQYIASYLGTFDDDVLDYQQPIKIFRGKTIFTDPDEYTPYFKVNDSVSIKISRISREAYEFWDCYSKNLTLSNNMFFSSPDKMPTNILGGKGFWCGMGSAMKNIVVTDCDKFVSP